ncbi:oocyte zinc finger protein XlCOF8.4-like [Hyperolius riggenbachi]|uniref:oocyte zinc finger protein XlCOF8.4-like n=1 Tax=Hyperolius riggenbachi TaxID=752182 RepID=UPI0035A2D3CC
MDKEQSQMAESIVQLALEIIYLLTGKMYRPIENKSHDSLPPFLTLKRNKKIVQVTNKMIELLTGEVPIRSQDVSVYFSMEEWQYIEKHKDLYEDVILESHPFFTSSDGSSNRKPPERCTSPLYSQDCPQEDNNSLNHDQGEDKTATKSEFKKELVEAYVSGDEPCEEEEISSEISTDESSCRTPPEAGTGPLYSWDCTWEDRTIPQRYHGEDVIDIKVEITDEDMEKEEVYVISNHKQETSLQNVPVLLSIAIPIDHLPCSSPSPPDERLVKNTSEEHPDWEPDENDFTRESLDVYSELPSLYRQPDLFNPEDSSETGWCSNGNEPAFVYQDSQSVEKFFPCTECEDFFTTKGDLVNHLRTHVDDIPFWHSEHSILERDQRLHTRDKPFSCYYCKKSFSRKWNLLRHQMLHTGEKPLMCPDCGKCFSRKSNLINHRRIHTGEKPFLCLLCDKSFTQKAGLNRHRRTH